MDIFLNQLIQLYSNNATNLHHLISHNTPRCPTTQRIVMWPQTTVTSLHLIQYSHACCVVVAATSTVVTVEWGRWRWSCGCDDVTVTSRGVAVQQWTKDWRQRSAK